MATDLGTPLKLSDAAVLPLRTVDLRRLSPADATTIRDVSHQRIAHLYCDTRPLEAFDVVVHLPHINLADADVNAVAHAPNDVQQALRHAKPDP